MTATTTKAGNPETEAMVQRLLNEELIPIPQAAEELSKLLGQPIDLSTVWRWVRIGVGGVRLEAIKAGRKNGSTSREAMRRFIVARSA